jgi:hypothetical protein
MKKFNRRPSTFNAIADIAAANHYRAVCSYFRPCVMTDEQCLGKIELANAKGHPGWGEPDFRHPTDHARGYWCVLKLIANAAGGLTRRELCEALKLKSISFQARRLEGAGFIKLDRDHTHKFTVTSFGKAYIAAVEAEFMF